jgi:hypothetical protein
MSQDGALLATGGNDALVTIWNTANTELINNIYQIDFPCNSVGISHDGSMLAYTGAREKGRFASVEIAEDFAYDNGRPPVIHRCGLSPRSLLELYEMTPSTAFYVWCSQRLCLSLRQEFSECQVLCAWIQVGLDEGPPYIKGIVWWHKRMLVGLESDWLAQDSSHHVANVGVRNPCQNSRVQKQQLQAFVSIADAQRRLSGDVASMNGAPPLAECAVTELCWNPNAPVLAFCGHAGEQAQVACVSMPLAAA